MWEVMGVCCEKSDYGRRDKQKGHPCGNIKGDIVFSMLIRFKMHYYMVVRPIHPTDFAERVLCIV